MTIYSQKLFIIYFSIQILILLLLFMLIKYMEHGGPLQRFHDKSNLGESISSFDRVEDPTEASPLLGNLLTPHSMHHSRTSNSLSSLDFSTRKWFFHTIRKWYRKKKRSLKIVNWLGSLYSIIGGFAASHTLVLANSGYPEKNVFL